jgi:DNA-directed RNA polymerase specialized sigma24 family protein
VRCAGKRAWEPRASTGSDCMRSDEELMAAYVRGDQEAFRELFRRYAPLVLGIVTRGVASRDDAEDLVQQTFLHVHRGRFDFRQDARALNVRREFSRRWGRYPATLVAPGALNGWASDCGDPETALRAARIRAAVQQLPDHQREVVELHWFAGLSFSEIAHAVGAKHSAVKVRAFRAYRVLRDRLGAGTEDSGAAAPADRRLSDELP